MTRDLSRLGGKESLWLLSFNPKKCKLMHLDYNNNPLNHYFLDGVLLEEVKAENNLGLLVSENLGWDINVSGRALKMQIEIKRFCHVFIKP